MASPSLFWTDERVKELKRLNLEGLSASVVGARLGCTRGAVLGKLSRLGLHSPRCKQPPKLKSRAKRKPIDRIRKMGGGLRLITTLTGDLFEARVVDVDPLHISFEQLTNLTCKYPFGDIPNMTFCGHLSAADSSYCLKHHRLSYRKPEPPKQPYQEAA